MSGSKAEWKEVLAIYAVAYNMTDTHPANPDEVQVVTLDESKEEYIRNLFWEINKIDHRIETYTETEQVEEKQKDGKVKKVNKQVQKKALYITVSHVDLETMMNNKGFTAEQKKMCRQLLSDENNDLWRELLNGVTSSNSDIVLIAQEQLGNVGGKPYWSWYGFSSRVEWCCCFVSWCANECGYIESGTIPKYSVVDDGVVWFKNKDQWLDGSEEPEPGMIIFFDWADDGLDGGGDHTGIVEKRVSLKKLRAAQFTQSKAIAAIRFARISTALATKKFWDMVSTQVTIPLRQVIQRSKCGRILKAMATQTALPQALSEI